MPVVRVPLVGSLKKRNADALDDFNAGIDQNFTNCTFQVFSNPVSGDRSIRVKGRPKFASSAKGGGAIPATAVKVWTGGSNAIATATTSTTNSTIYVNTTSLGSITGKGIFFSETTIGTTANLLVVSSGNRAYYYPDGGSLTEITDTDFPPKQMPALTITGNFVHKNGFAYIMCTNGQIWNSDLNSLSGWSANAFISAQERPDNGIGLATVGKYIIGFGANSTEFFESAGNPVGSPLSRVTHINVGVPNQYCIAQFKDSVAFIGSDSGSFGVYIVNGPERPQKVSSPDLDESMAQSASGLRLNVMAWFGKAYLVVTIASTLSGVTGYVVIDVELGLSTFMDLSGESGMTQSDVVIGSDGAYNCYYVGPDSIYAWRENNTACPAMSIHTSSLDFGTSNEKSMTRMRLVGEAQSNNTVTAQWGNDDHGSTAGTRDFTIGSGAGPATAYRLQTFSKRWFVLTNTTPTIDFGLQSMEFEYEEHVK